MQEQDFIFNQDKFLLHQKRLSISEKYYVFDEQKNPILFIERPRHMARNLGAALVGVVVSFIILCTFYFIFSILIEQSEIIASLSCFVGIALALIAYFVIAIALSQKRHLTFYQDDTKQHPLLEVKQDKKIDFPYVTFTVLSANGDVLAYLKKNYLYNLFRKRWDCFNPENVLLSVVQEDSPVLALLRRVLGPLFGVLRTNFIILDAKQQKQLGEFNRKFTIADRYVLDMSADTKPVLDRRIALAIGVLLDTAERR